MLEGSFIKIGGILLEDALLVSVTVIQELNAHWWCNIECRQTQDKRFPAEDLLGKDVSVSAVAQNNGEHALFTGVIIESELEYEIYGSQRARLQAVSRSYLLDLTPRRAYYFQKTPEQVVQQLISMQGLALDGTLDGKQLSYVQLDETDFRFIQRFADESEKWLRPSGTGLQVRDAFQPGATLDWRGEYGLIAFEARGKLVAPSSSGAHYDYRKMRSLSAEGVRDQPPVFGASARMFAAAQGQSSKFGAAYVSGRDRLLGLEDLQPSLQKQTRRPLGSAVVCRGLSRDPRIRAGDEVTIQGTLDANGTYGVLRVVHSWTANGYENEFLCTVSKKYTNPHPEPAPRFDGVVPARVADNNDPQGIGRIRIQHYWQEENHSCWVRSMAPHAGADRGFLTLPEIGDEVWVMFEEGDPERASILGSAWNGVHHPPRDEFWRGDVAPNDVKRIVTKSGNRITLSDKPDKNAIILATPNHLNLSMLENSSETGDAMLALHSDGDIFLSAPNGRIHFNSKFFSREVGERTNVDLAGTSEKLDSRKVSDGSTSAPMTMGEKTITEAIEIVRRSAFAKSPDGKKVLRKISRLQESGNIKYQSGLGRSRGQWGSGTITINDAYNRDAEATASELVHEGTHAVHEDDFPASKIQITIDEEIRTNVNQIKLYGEQQSRGFRDPELERRMKAYHKGKLRDDVRGRYPGVPESLPK